MTEDTIVRLDPTLLLVGPNVRKEVDLSKEFVSSIKQLGVRVPITAALTADGYEVIDGQRRTLAAVDAGLKEVPVFVTAPESWQQEGAKAYLGLLEGWGYELSDVEAGVLGRKPGEAAAA